MSWNKLTSLPKWLRDLSNLKTLALCGCDSLDFGLLADLINGSAIAEIDLSYCSALIKFPATLTSFLKKIKRIKRLRSGTSLPFPSLFCSFNGVFWPQTRIYGQAAIMTNEKDDRDDWKAAKQALNETSVLQNSKFAHAVIQTLNSPSFGSIE